MVEAVAFDAGQVGRSGSLACLAAAYVADLAARNYSGDTVNTRRVSLIAFCAWCADRDVLLAAQVTRPLLERFQRHLAHAKGPKGQPLSVGYQIHRVKAVQLLFRWAVRSGRVGSNPAADLDLPRRMKPLPAVLTPAEAETVLAQPDLSTATGLRDRAFMELLYSTGLRRVEGLRLALTDVDHAHGTVRVIRGKGNKDRVVPIGQRALGWVERWRDEARPLWAGEQETALWLNRRGNPFSRDECSKMVKRHLKAAGIAKPGSCHLFRHTMATALHEAGCDVRLIQEILGHAKLDTTAVYTHVGIGRLRAAHAAFHPAEATADG